jgi:DNA ligase (NAD+)
MLYSSQQQNDFYTLSKRYFEPETISDGDVITHLKHLRQLIEYHEWRYYVQNDPVISDYEYDILYKQLEKIESENPDLITPNSPTQRVSSDLTEEFQTVAHKVPMLSLDNSYNAEDLNKFDEQIKKLTARQDIEYVVEPKFDGGSITLIYENDVLLRAATRGNGQRGEEMTPNARTIRTIPLKAEFSQFGFQSVELRGEAVIRKDLFNKINEKREAEGLTILANPRNSAAGGLRTKDPSETSKRSIEAFIFQFGYGVNAEGQDQMKSLGTHFQAMEALEKLGFKIPTVEKKKCQNIQEVIDFCIEWENKRDAYAYEIDGMVIKVNDFNLQELCGSTSHHPRWAIAYKFKAKQATTRLLNVEYQVGKVGSVTPVAKVEPVQLAGVTVSSISLHNEDFIKNKDIRIGDTVLIERAGDVIPYIVKSMEDLRTGKETPIDFPTECPVCNTHLVRHADESAWRCPNMQCAAQVTQRMIYHVSKDAMDIDGFGSMYIRRFHELGWLKTMADIYRLDYDAIAALEGFGDKSAQKLKRSIEIAKTRPIHRLLSSLSIHHLGKRASKLIAERIRHVLDLETWQLEDFLDIKDIGPVVAENVIDFFAVPENILMLKEMEALGLNLHQTEEDKPLEIAADAPLAGKTILFTGTLQKMGRKAAQKMAAEAGAKNISAVSSNLDILVAGEKAGSKLTKAQKLGTVQILTEDEFLDLIQS